MEDQLSIPLEYFPRLLNAKPSERENYVLSGNGTGIHWEELDEDISVPGLLLGKRDVTHDKISPTKTLLVNSNFFYIFLLNKFFLYK